MSSLRTQVIRLAAQNKELGKVLYPLLKKTASTITLDATTTSSELLTEFLRKATEDFSVKYIDASIGNGIFAAEILEEVWNPNEPGESDYRDFEFRFNFRTNQIGVFSYGKKLGLTPMNLWESTPRQVAVKLKALAKQVPGPKFSQPDSPSLQDSSPWGYDS